MNKFQIAYGKLNAEQKQAVDAIEGPVMVIAGPGTGKTQVLTLRIANILAKTDTPPEGILALTFTESAATAMRRRLAELIGAAAYRVTITTFHGFANSIIKNYPDEFPEIIGANNITDVDQVTIIRRVIDTAPLKNLRPFGDRYFYLHPIIGAINELKRQGIDPRQFAEIAAHEKAAFQHIDDLVYESGPHKGKMKGKYLDAQKHIQRNEELVTVYEEYQRELAEAKLYDYSDMIMRVMAALAQSKEFLLMLQEQYLYILVDEHQDTNSAQNKILELLANFHQQPNLFVVGDEQQAIFRFQGASLENFLYFQKQYGNVKLIALQQNYRSTQAILDAAHHLAPHKKPLRANAGHPETPLVVNALSAPEVESSFIVEAIKQRIADGVAAEEIAVLYRENRDAVPIAHALEKAGVPFTIESDQDVLKDPDIRKLLLLLKAVQHFGSAPELLAMLHVDVLGIPPLDVYKITYAAAKRRINPYDIIRSPAILEEIGVEAQEKLIEIYRLLSAWKSNTRNSGAAEAFEDIVRESGMLTHLLASSAVYEKLDKLHALFDQIKMMIEGHRDYTLEHFFEYLDVVHEHNVLIKSRGISNIKGRVHLMTAHKSKGLEFDYVYIINVADGKWGSRRRAEHIQLPRRVYALLEHVEETFTEHGDADERHLFYVALTRARKQVTISYALHGTGGREQLPSQFIQEIKPELLTMGQTDAFEEQWRNHKERVFAPAPHMPSVIKEKAFVQELFSERGLSVTALNNYLKCPWRYFYVNLIRLPEAPQKPLMYGSAIHEALKNYFDIFSKGEDPDKEYLVRRFTEALGHQPANQKDFEEMNERGRQALSGYYDQYRQQWIRRAVAELPVNGISIAEGVLINGKIDKMEILDDAGKVNVVDYKTGKPKTRNEIEGLTKTSDGDYKRQLVFYHLLLNHFHDGKYKMVSGQIDFVEPDAKGRYHNESFEVTEEEVSHLTDQIKAVAGEITSLSFWDKNCDDPDCHYCELSRLVR